MSLSSMTGFARTAGSSGPYRWTIELKSVNAKGLDLRLRIAPGFERVEIEARSKLAGALARGTCFAALSVQRDRAMPHVRINTPALTALAIAAGAAARNANLAPPTIDGLLAVRGIVEVIDADDDEATLADACARALASFGEAVEALGAARRGEGAALSLVLAKRLEAIDALTRAADINPGRRPEAVRARLALTLESLIEAGRGFDENRLHQEAVLIAAKADIQEELDRLATHIAAAREVMSVGVPVGRKLDFLAQEMAREANTLCAKSNNVSLTAVGLDLRAQIEQFREQVQNIE